MIKKLFVITTVLSLTACALTPEEKAEREAQRIRAEQQLQVNLAKQCDVETAELMNQKFNPPISQTDEEKKVFEEKYAEKVNNEMFQACYKMALQNYKTQEELRQMRQHYYDNDFRFSLGVGYWGGYHRHHHKNRRPPPPKTTKTNK